MNSISNIDNALSAYLHHSEPVRKNGKSAQAMSDSDSDGGGDTVQLSSMREEFQNARISKNVDAGNLTTDQAATLHTQMDAIQQQIATDKQNDGGSLNGADAASINQMQNQLGQFIHHSSHPSTIAPAPDPSAGS